MKIVGMKTKYQKSAIADALNILDYDPLLKMIEISLGEDCDLRLKYDVNKELLSYLSSKPKRIELVVEDSESKMKQEMIDRLNTLMLEHKKAY
jgi:hypothetical protein